MGLNRTFAFATSSGFPSHPQPCTEFTFRTTPADMPDHGEVELWHDCESQSQQKIKLLDLPANS